MENRHSDSFMIYQLKQNDRARALRFAAFEQLRASGGSVDWGNYNHIYTGELKSEKKLDVVDLEIIFCEFNDHLPEDYLGASLSVSDVVVIYRGGNATAYYVNLIDYERVPEFLAAPYRYYLTRRPVDIGTFPKVDGGPVRTVSFEEPEDCEYASFRAWGYVAYDAPLTDEQVAGYELRPASDNPDGDKQSRFQLAAREIRTRGEGGHTV